MRTTLHLASDRRLYLQAPDIGLDRQRTLDEADFEHLRELTREYRVSLRHANPTEQHLAIGRDLFRWLNRDRWLEDLLPDVSPPWLLEVQVGNRPDDAPQALSETPWELLAEPSGDHLARDLGVQLNPVRRFGTPGEPAPPLPNRLSLVFMAAAPNDQAELQYEAEEVAILQATEEMHGGGRINIDLTVEESGSLRGLSALAAREAPVAVLHISCHGGFDESEPVLAMEQPMGGVQDPVDARRLLMEPSIRDARLLFLSACHSADRRRAEDQKVVDSLAAQLLRGGLRASLGWAGAVADAEAIEFSGHLYRFLSQHQPLETAVGAARLALLNRPADQPRSRDWHRVRLYLGPQGGGVLANGTRARHQLNAQTGHREFLDAKGDQTVPVASRYEFVGRRRQIQEVLRALNDPAHAGVLIHGMGRQGKSSLAARIANRLHDHATVVVYGHYEAADILTAIASQFEHPTISAIVERHRDAVRQDPTRLGEAMRELLQGPCRQASDKHEQPAPLLLIIDDLEQALMLDEGDRYHRVQRPEVRQALTATLHAFHHADSDSRLLLTCRYRFTLADGQGGDMSERLHHLHLQPMGPGERQKQVIQRRKTLANWAPEREDWALTRRSMELAKGNPGLQELLYRLSVNDAETARTAMQGVQAWLQGGGVPTDEEELRKMLEGLVLEQVHARLTPREKDLLRASTLFRLPVPVEVVDALAGADPAPRERLLAVGLFDAWPDPVDGEHPAVALNPMAQAVAGSVSSDDAKALADMALPPLWQAWSRHQRPSIADIQLTELALHLDDSKVLRQCAARAVSALYDSQRFREAADQGTRAVEILEAHAPAVPPALLRHTASALVSTGQADDASELYQRAMDAGTEAHKDQHDYAATLVEHARLLVNRGNPDAAMERFREALDLFPAGQYDRDRSVILGDIARIMVDKGQVDDALKLHQERIEVFQALGDQRSRALTLGDIARIMVSKGQVDDALKLHQEEMDVFQALGDQRSRAVTLGDIARIMVSKGQVDDALKLHQERIEVFQALGDQRSRALTLGDIARIMVSKGQVDDALKLHQEEMDVFQALGDQRSRAVTLGDIARIMVSKGQVDDALKLHQERIEVFQALGDQRERAVTLGDIARIMVSKGQVDDALKLHQERIEVFQALGDQRSRAVTLGDIARIMVSKGQVDDALKLHQERIEVFQALGDQRSRALTLGDIARIMVDKGQVDDALKLHQERIEVFQALGDQRSRALTLGDIARIMVSKGQVDDALKLHQEEMDVFQALGDQRSRAVTLGDIARIMVSKGQVDDALKLHQERIEVFQALGDQRSRALTLGDIARIMVSKGQVDDALKLHQEEMDVFQALGDQRERAVTLGDIARIMVSKGQVDDALKLHQERIEVFQALGDQRERAVTLGDIARIMVSKGQVDDALKLHQERIEVFQALGDQRERAVTLGDIARIMVSKGQVDDALKLHQEQLVVAKELGDADSIANASWSIGRIEIQREQMQSAFKHMHEAYKILQKTGRLDGIVFVGLDLGRLLAMGGHPKDGLQVLERSRQGLIQLGQSETAAQVEALMERIRNEHNHHYMIIGPESE